MNQKGEFGFIKIFAMFTKFLILFALIFVKFSQRTGRVLSVNSEIFYQDTFNIRHF